MQLCNPLGFLWDQTLSCFSEWGLGTTIISDIGLVLHEKMVSLKLMMMAIQLSNTQYYGKIVLRTWWALDTHCVVFVGSLQAISPQCLSLAVLRKALVLQATNAGVRIKAWEQGYGIRTVNHASYVHMACIISLVCSAPQGRPTFQENPSTITNWTDRVR